MTEAEFGHINVLMQLVSGLSNEIWNMQQTLDSLEMMKDKYQNMIFNLQDKELDKWVTSYK